MKSILTFLYVIFPDSFKVVTITIRRRRSRQAQFIKSLQKETDERGTRCCPSGNDICEYILSVQRLSCRYIGFKHRA